MTPEELREKELTDAKGRVWRENEANMLDQTPVQFPASLRIHNWGYLLVQTECRRICGRKMSLCSSRSH